MLPHRVKPNSSRLKMAKTRKSVNHRAKMLRMAGMEAL
jgi:hypothetical protein